MPELWKPLTGLKELTPGQLPPIKLPKTGTPETSQAMQTGAAANTIAIPTKLCRICGNAIPADFCQVNGQLACIRCAKEAGVGRFTNSSAAYSRGLQAGLAAAVVALIFYAMFTITINFYFHFYVGYLALAVGWLIGKAMVKGSDGIGGWRFQKTAMLLTYAVISLSSVPVLISQVAPAGDFAWGPMFGRLVLVGIAAPFLDLMTPMRGFIGLVILFFSLRIAYKLTAGKPLAVEGPFR